MLEDTILATKKMDKYAQIEPFDPAEDSSEDYSQQLDMAFALNGLKDSDAGGITYCLRKENIQATEVAMHTEQAKRKVLG